MTSENHISMKKEWAILWAVRGFHVFPCNGKIPLIKGWPELATTNTHDIERWWNIWPDANIGCAPDKSGHFVVDIDSKKGKPGYETWTALQLEHEFVSGAMEVATPSGGKHVWFYGHGPSTVERLGPGLDTRGRDGFILMGGSSLDGRDYQASPLEPGLCPVPEWLLGKLGSETERADRALGDIELDLTHNIERAQRFLETAKPAIEGQGGNALTYNTACWLRDFGISEQQACDMMLTGWNERCEPPWDEEELDNIVANAYEFGRNEPGSKAIPNPNNLYDEVSEENITHKKDVLNIKWSFNLCDPAADALLPPVTYRDALKLWPDSPEKTVTQVIAGPKCHKTNWIMAEMFRLSQAGKARVLMLALEGAYGVRTMRLKRLAEYHSVSLESLKGMFQVAITAKGGMFDLSNSSCVAEFVKWLRTQDWTDVIIDTQHRAAGGLEENSATDARTLWNSVEAIRQLAKVNVTLAHHQGKDTSKGGRGSSADLASVDQQISLDYNRDVKVVHAKVTARKDGLDGFTVPFKVVQASELDVPVLVAMSKEEAQSIRGTDPYSNTTIGQALQNLGAVGVKRRVSSATLAVELLRMWGELPEDDTEMERKKRTVSTRLAEKIKKSSRLYAYMERTGTEILKPYHFFLPEID